MGGGGMLRAAGRPIGPVVGGVQGAVSASRSKSTTHNKPTSNIFSLSFPVSSSLNLPFSATSKTAPTWPSCSSKLFDGDEWERESVDGGEDERADGFYDRHVFRSVPSKNEVEDAVSSLQQVLAPALYSQLIEENFPSSSYKDVADQNAYPTGSETTPHLNNPRSVQSHQRGRVYDAFHLLQTEPSIKRMVLSLSSDKAVWDAVSNNEVVRELRESFCTVNAAENAKPQSFDGSTDMTTSILRWILDLSKAAVMELIVKLFNLVNEVFKPATGEETTAVTTDLFEEMLSSSFLLTILVLLIVVVTRASGV